LEKLLNGFKVLEPIELV